MVEVTLFCALVREGSVFSVVIDTSKSVGHLKDAIKAKNTATITCDARNLQFFLAKKNGTWLQDNAPLRSELDASYVEISDVWKLENPVLFGPNVSLGENVVHVLVVTPRQPHPARLKRWEKLNELLDRKKKARLNYADELSTVGPTGDSYDSEKITTNDNMDMTDMAPQPHPAHMLRWEKLNELLGRNKKGKPNFADDKPTVASTGDSYISIDDNEEIMRTDRYEQPSKAIANDTIDTLYAYLLVVIRAFGHMVTGKDVNRLYFILPILACVCERFDGEARILTDRAVVGKRVHGEGYFDFIMERGSTRVCVVLVKREDFQKGLAQAYLGCEILADVEALTKVYSVVTSFNEWYFNRSLDDKIERTDITVVLTNDIPTRESVKRIAEKIYSMLSDDD